MARLTVRSVAEMLQMPAYKQSRILTEQKYPKQQPQSFQVPYYQPALSGIREFYRSGNDPKAISAASNALQSIGNVTRRTNNLRVLQNFANSKHAKRKLTPQSNSKYEATVGKVSIRLSPDLQAIEGGKLHVIYFNTRITAIDDETAAVTTEIAHWVLQQSGVSLAINEVEVLDIANGKRHIRTKARPKTIKLLKANATVIQAIWDNI